MRNALLALGWLISANVEAGGMEAMRTGKRAMREAEFRVPDGTANEAARDAREGRANDVYISRVLLRQFFDRKDIDAARILWYNFRVPSTL